MRFRWGAVVVREGQVPGSGHNQRERRWDVTAHAEILALRSAAGAARDWRLDGATLYVTLEPCPMCTAALNLARIERIVFGAADDLHKARVARSWTSPTTREVEASACRWWVACLAKPSASLLSRFFRPTAYWRRTAFWRAGRVVECVRLEIG